MQKSGSWYSIGDERIGQGRDNAKNYLRDNPDVAENLEAAIRREAQKAQAEKAQKRMGAAAVAATAATKAVDVSADDFDDGDDMDV